MKQIANGKLRWLLARDKSVECANLRVGGSVIFYELVGRKSAPKRRGPAVIMDIDETGATVKFQGRMFKVRRSWAR